MRRWARRALIGRSGPEQATAADSLSMSGVSPSSTTITSVGARGNHMLHIRQRLAAGVKAARLCTTTQDSKCMSAATAEQTAVAQPHTEQQYSNRKCGGAEPGPLSAAAAAAPAAAAETADMESGQGDKML